MGILRDGEGWQPSDHRIKTTLVCTINLHPWVELGLILENKSVLPQWLGLILLSNCHFYLKKTLSLFSLLQDP